MTKIYNRLLKEHVIHTLTNHEMGSLKEYTQHLIQQNSAAREEILKAYHQVNDEILGKFEE